MMTKLGYKQINGAEISLLDEGAVSGEDSTTAIGTWLDKLIATGATGYVPDGEFLCDYVTKTANNGIRIRGPGTIKATGDVRTNIIRLTGVHGKVDIDEITLDCNNLTSRGIEVLNNNSTPSTLGSINFGSGLTVKNVLNPAGQTRAVFGIYVQGGFSEIKADCTIAECDSQPTSGAEAYGLVVTWSGSADDDWCRRLVLGPNFHVKDVKNSNTVLENADGVQFFAPTDKVATLVVVPGATFENCKGRSLKSQVYNNCVNGPVAIRTKYDGLTEFDFQYAGGYCRGAVVYHNGTRVDNIINVTQRLDTGVSHCDIDGNNLHVVGTPSSATTNMVQVFGTDVTDSIVNQGVTVRNNKVFGAVDHFITGYGTNVEDVNLLIDQSNWAQTVNVAWFNLGRVNNNRAQLTYNVKDNVCVNGCIGADTEVSPGQQGDLKVIEDVNNIGITAMTSNPVTYTAVGGTITPNGERSIRVNGEGNVADTINNIDMTNYSPDDILYISSGSTVYNRTFETGTGNLRLGANVIVAGDAVLAVRKVGSVVQKVSFEAN